MLWETWEDGFRWIVNLVVIVWTLLVWEQGVKYEEQVLLALLTWSKNHRLDTIEVAALDIKTWEWTGRFIIEAASIGDEAAINIINPWRLVLNLLRQLKAKQDAWTAVGMLWVLPTEACSENRAQGGIGTTLGTRDKRMGKAAPPCRDATPDKSSAAVPCHAATPADHSTAVLCHATMLAEHYVAAPDCVATPADHSTSVLQCCTAPTVAILSPAPSSHT